MSSIRETLLSMFYDYFCTKPTLAFNFYSANEGSVDTERVLYHPAVVKMAPGQIGMAALKNGKDGLVMMTAFGPVLLFISQPGYEITRRVVCLSAPAFTQAASLGDFPSTYSTYPVNWVVDGNTLHFNVVRSVAMMERIMSMLEVVPSPA